MKLLVFNDVHANPDALKVLKEKAVKENPDLLVCCGDISNFGLDLDFSVKEILSIGIKTLMIPGNHETPKEIEEISKKHNLIIDIHNKFFEHDNFLFFGHGTKTFTTTDPELEKLIPSVAEKVKLKKLIFITHAPIFNTALDLLPIGHNGSRTARDFVDAVKPMLVLCGDFHENFGKEDFLGKTRIVNAGDEGMIIDIEK